MVPVVTALLFPVFDSICVVVISTVWVKVNPELNVVAKLPVKTIVPPLPPGSDPIGKLLAFKVTCPSILLVMCTLSAVFPPLFP